MIKVIVLLIIMLSLIIMCNPSTEGIEGYKDPLFITNPYRFRRGFYPGLCDDYRTVQPGLGMYQYNAL